MFFGWRPPAQFRFYGLTVFRLGMSSEPPQSFTGQSENGNQLYVCGGERYNLHYMARFSETTVHSGGNWRDTIMLDYMTSHRRMFFRFFGKGGAGVRQINPNQPNRTRPKGNSTGGNYHEPKAMPYTCHLSRIIWRYRRKNSVCLIWLPPRM